MRVISDDFLTRGTVDEIDLTKAPSHTVDSWARLRLPEAVDEVLRRRGMRFNPNHGKGGKFASGGPKVGPSGGGIGSDGYEALRPTDRGFSKTRRDAAIGKLQGTPDGKVLADVITDFQDGARIDALRQDIAGVNASGRGQTKKGTDRARVFLKASANVPQDLLPGKVYRGISVSGDPRQIAAAYREQSHTTMNASSFTSSSRVAREFTEHPTGSNVGRARIMLEVDTTGKSQMLPVENFSKTPDLFREQEFIGLGTFAITDVSTSGDTVRLKLKQTGLILPKDDR